jgi:site-specific recombinase XerD
MRGVFERFKGSGVWYVRYADANGKLRRERVGPKSAALSLYNKRKTQILLQEKLPETFRAKPISFEKLAANALTWSVNNKRSYRNDKNRMVGLIEAFGDRPAESITPGDFERYLNAQMTWGGATKNRCRALLKMIYRLAEHDELIRINPARKLRSTKEQGRVRWLSETEEAVLRNFIPPKRLPEFELALNTGMRKGEQYELLWENVDLERGVLTIPRSKNGETRFVPLNSAALNSLRVLKNEAEGRVFSLTNPRYWFETAIGKSKTKNFHWHDLRHTFASGLVMKGVDIRTVSELLGHKSIIMTMRYAHLSQSHLMDAVEKLA